MCWIWIWQMALHFTRFLNLQRCGSLLGKCISSWNFVFLSTVMGSRTFLYKSFHIPKLDIGCKFLLKKLTSNFRLEAERWGLCNNLMHCVKVVYVRSQISWSQSILTRLQYIKHENHIIRTSIFILLWYFYHNKIPSTVFDISYLTSNIYQFVHDYF